MLTIAVTRINVKKHLNAALAIAYKMQRKKTGLRLTAEYAEGYRYLIKLVTLCVYPLCTRFTLRFVPCLLYYCTTKLNLAL